jgi:hypothetical protein
MHFDECKENGMRELIEFLEGLGDTAVSPGTSINMSVKSPLSTYQGIQLTVDRQGGYDKNIATYIESKFKVPHSKQMDDIRAGILSRASGVFPWVVLVVQMLNKEYDHGQITVGDNELTDTSIFGNFKFADVISARFGSYRR